MRRLAAAAAAVALAAAPAGRAAERAPYVSCRDRSDKAKVQRGGIVQGEEPLVGQAVEAGVAHVVHDGRPLVPASRQEGRGFIDGVLTLGDEVLTPDSSRFWPAGQYKPGGAQFSYDKQFVRDYLEQIRWNKHPPVPSLPDEVVAKTRGKYLEAFERLTGRALT